MTIFSKIIVISFRFWHKSFSFVLGNACRFEPTCSVYGAEAVEKYGVFKGLWLALKRLGRCHPWGSHGFDPLP